MTITNHVVQQFGTFSVTKVVPVRRDHGRVHRRHDAGLPGGLLVHADERPDHVGHAQPHPGAGRVAGRADPGRLGVHVDRDAHRRSPATSPIRATCGARPTITPTTCHHRRRHHRDGHRHQQLRPPVRLADDRQGGQRRRVHRRHDVRTSPSATTAAPASPARCTLASGGSQTVTGLPAGSGVHDAGDPAGPGPARPGLHVGGADVVAESCRDRSSPAAPSSLHGHQSRPWRSSARSASPRRSPVRPEGISGGRARSTSTSPATGDDVPVRHRRRRHRASPRCPGRHHVHDHRDAAERRPGRRLVRLGADAAAAERDDHRRRARWSPVTMTNTVVRVRGQLTIAKAPDRRRHGRRPGPPVRGQLQLPVRQRPGRSPARSQLTAGGAVATVGDLLLGSRCTVVEDPATLTAPPVPGRSVVGVAAARRSTRPEPSWSTRPPTPAAVDRDQLDPAS